MRNKFSKLALAATGINHGEQIMKKVHPLNNYIKLSYFMSFLNKAILVTFAGILFTSCAPTTTAVPSVPYYVNVFVKLRPDLSEDDAELWEVLGKETLYSEGVPSYTSFLPVMKKKAAEKSEAEGYDCFYHTF